MTTVTREQARNQTLFPLPIFQVQVTKIDVTFPCKFKPLPGNKNEINVEPAEGFDDLIGIYYDDNCDS